MQDSVSATASATVSASAAVEAAVQTSTRYRRVGLRMSCASCEVAWTGAADSQCWVCDEEGVPGPPPSIYPDID